MLSWIALHDGNRISLPVHKILSDFARICLVKNIGDRKLTDSNDKPIGCVRSGELILIRLYLLGLTSKIDSLAQKEALNARVRNGRADFERGPARKAGNSFGIAETKSLIEFRIDRELCVFPEFDANKIHEIKAFTALIGERLCGPI